jgi:hypothetical protein
MCMSNVDEIDIIREGNNFEEILAGLTMQPSEAYDTNFVNDVSQHDSTILLTCLQSALMCSNSLALNLDFSGS